jgi:hypothetical protein
MLQQPIMFIVDSRVGPAGTTFIITEFCINNLSWLLLLQWLPASDISGEKQDYRYLQINLMRHILFELGRYRDM